jgi:hypothetical protein
MENAAMADEGIEARGWKAFDELRELNAQGGRLAAAVGIMVAVLGAIGARDFLDRLIHDLSNSNPSVAQPAWLLLVPTMFGVAALGVAGAYALLLLRTPVPDNDAELDGLVDSKRRWCKASASGLTFAIWALICVVGTGDPAVLGWVSVGQFVSIAVFTLIVVTAVVHGLPRLRVPRVSSRKNVDLPRVARRPHSVRPGYIAHTDESAGSE